MSTRERSIRKVKLAHSLETRRVQALERQQQTRHDSLMLVRQMASAGLDLTEDQQPTNFTEQHLSQPQKVTQPADVHMEGTSQQSQNQQKRQQRYAGQLMLPEWMLQIPQDFTTNWIVLPRPEGQQCLVIAFRGRVVTRLRSGRVLHKVRGTNLNKIAAHGLTLLDAVFNQESMTYYVMDVLIWKDYLMVDCQADFRMFWLQQQIAPEIQDSKKKEGGQAGTDQLSFQVVPSGMECSAEMLQQAKDNDIGIVRDGLLFLHKQGHYLIDSEAPSPLALRWKDETCSRYPIDTDKDERQLDQQTIQLNVTDDYSLATIDDPSVIVGHVNQLQNVHDISKITPGKIVKAKIASPLHVAEDGLPSQPVQLILDSLSRGRADTWSRILFQYYVRTQNSISFAQILDASKRQVPEDMEH
eukprot:TRINITY_DN532_c0_g1_i3.p1 TRINITY_DN532_c0_g1~~TRINITY_DN532_c0_g1_i3.p1  ORF type:complete len:413 (+),score=44.25 TRINITY_DN532_c0_g1_i3:252-1490(+)